MSSYQPHHYSSQLNHQPSFTSSTKSNSSGSSSTTTHQRHTSQSSLSSITSSSTLPSNTPLDPNQSSIRDENEKLNKRLLLLRDEYVKLQAKHSDLQSRYDRLASTGGLVSLDPETSDFTNSSASKSTLASRDSSVAFVSKILDFIGGLFNNSEYSDLKIEFSNGEVVYAHKFVLKFRSKEWGRYGDLDRVDRLELKELSPEVGMPLFRWIYSGVIALNSKDEDFILETVRYATQFHLTPLIEQCEEALIGFVRVENCIYFYQISEELRLLRLCEYSSKLVTLYWDTLSETDFHKASTEFLHRLFKEKSRYPLHKAIRIRNEDLIFLLLVDFNSQLSFKVNEFDNLGTIPLDLALQSGQYSIARNLLDHQGNVNAVDQKSWPLLARYIQEGLLEAARFLINSGASVGNTNPEGDSALHLAADKVSTELESEESGSVSIYQIVELLVEKNINLNLQNNRGDTALHRCIRARNVPIFDLLLVAPKSNLELQNRSHESPFSLSLDLISDDCYYFAEQLLTKQVMLDWCSPESGDSLLHKSVRNGNEKAALFLVENGTNVNAVNNRGETILHLSSYMGFKNLVSILLQKNANCNLLTFPPVGDLSPQPQTSISAHHNGDPFAELDEEPSQEVTIAEQKSLEPGQIPSDTYNQTPLHLAILGRHEAIIKEILSYHDRASRKGLLDSALLTPDLNIKNSKHQTPLSLAVQLQLTEIAEMLINAGADIDVRNQEGLTLLHQSIMSKDDKMAHFLLLRGSDFTARTRTGETYLQFAVRFGLPTIVRELCTLGADVNVRSATTGDPVIWEALSLMTKSAEDQDSEQDIEEIPSILVQNRCDVDYWYQTEDPGFRQTLLLRALDENKEAVARFLVRAGCDIHCTRKPGKTGEGAEDCDGQTPLHMACAWGMVQVVETLLEHSVDPNIADQEGKSALHIAILNQSQPIILHLIEYPATDLYRTDNYGNSPFSLSVKLKSRVTAQALTKRDSHIGEQIDGKGRNYLHLALERSDYDSVLFLLDNQVNISARVQDSVKKAPIHLAAETGSEIILRTLVLAGCDVNDITMQNQTALHLAAELNNHQTAEILLDLNINAQLQDNAGNNALHISCLRGHLETSQALLDRKVLDLRVTNVKGQTVVHCLAASSDKTSSSAIFDHLIQLYPDVDLNARDAEGSTALLVAYMNGNGKLCRSIVGRGAALGVRNIHGISIFNHQMPTRQLLTSLLDSLTRMPDWRDGPECLECGVKFGMTNRRHHCRHCGRELCSKCSSKEVIIMKFQQEKKSANSRVCELCNDVLTIGVFN